MSNRLFYYVGVGCILLLVGNRMLNSQQKAQELKAEVQQNTTPQITPPQPTHTENTAFQGSYTQQNTPPHPTTSYTHRITTCNGIEGDANLRQEPGGNIIGLIPNGEGFAPVVSRNGWIQVESDQGTGWIHSCFLP